MFFYHSQLHTFLLLRSESKDVLHYGMKGVDDMVLKIKGNQAIENQHKDTNILNRFNKTSSVIPQKYQFLPPLCRVGTGDCRTGRVRLSGWSCVLVAWAAGRQEAALLILSNLGGSDQVSRESISNLSNATTIDPIANRQKGFCFVLAASCLARLCCQNRENNPRPCAFVRFFRADASDCREESNS